MKPVELTINYLLAIIFVVFRITKKGGNWLPPGYYNKDHDERGASEDDDSDDLFKVENWKSEGNQKQENEISEEEEDEAQYDNEDITMIDSMFR